jgi:hypothetical protein
LPRLGGLVQMLLRRFLVRALSNAVLVQFFTTTLEHLIVFSTVIDDASKPEQRRVLSLMVFLG